MELVNPSKQTLMKDKPFFARKRDETFNGIIPKNENRELDSDFVKICRKDGLIA
jgi:hypothetical protein